MAEAARKDEIATGTDEVNSGHLRAFIERIERLEEEKKALSDDIKDVYGEAKATASTSRSCASSFPYANRTATSGWRKRRSSTFISPRSG